MERRTLDITPGPLALFCARLKRLQAASGINQSRLLSAAHLGRSQMSDILNGKIRRLPDWDVTNAVVRACLEYAKTSGRPVPPDLRDEGDWRRRYADLEHDLETETRPKPPRELPGRLLAEVTDPFDLEVHWPVQPDAPQQDLPVLPAYVTREHDAELEWVAAAAARGASGIAVLVGESSTGKTRACWEALRLLRERPEPWRLWHPIDPTRPEAALRELPLLGPRTVVWLNEAQFYLDVHAGGLGERIAAGLREALRDPARAPVLVLATLWPQHWDALAARPAAGADPHAQARELLTGRDISVPAAFTAARLRQLAGAADPRLTQAARAAEGGQVIQFLAGAPELTARYRNAPQPAAALISTAMDARRMGMGVVLPLTFLETAAPGYLTDTEWDGLSEDWLERALAYTSAPCRGIRGPLARIRTRPGPRAEPDRGPATGWPTTWSSTAAVPAAPTFPQPASGTQQPASPPLPTCRPSPKPPRPTACSATRPASASAPPLTGTPRRQPLSFRTGTSRSPTRPTRDLRSGLPTMPPSTIRTASPGCCSSCGRRARNSRSPGCSPAIPPRTPPSMTQQVSPCC